MCFAVGHYKEFSDVWRVLGRFDWVKWRAWWREVSHSFRAVCFKALPGCSRLPDTGGRCMYDIAAEGGVVVEENVRRVGLLIVGFRTLCVLCM